MLKLLNLWLLLITIVIVSFPTFSQPLTTTLSGTVTDATTQQPMPFASVYLDGTTRGTTTDAQGRYKLTNVPLGTLHVVASFMGYQTHRQTVRFNNSRGENVYFRLKPSEGILGAITVRAKSRDRAWQRHYKQFQRQLLGEPFGGQCQITNSFVLSFREEGSTLYATATEPLIIENKALGYRLNYELLSFKGTMQRVYYAGTCRFEELTPTDDRQRARFVKNRMQAYRGSLRHLMTTLVNGRAEQNGFLIYSEDLSKSLSRNNDPPLLYDAIRYTKRLTPIQTDSVIKPGKLSFERQLVSAKPFVIFYTGASSAFSPYRDARFAYSTLDLPRGPMGFTTDGWITIPNGVEIKGSLADDRLSTLLPADWKPEKTGVDAVVEVPLLTQGQLLPSDTQLSKLSNTLTDLFASPSPSIYIHTDKSLYATGERIWFSGYLLDAFTHQRTSDKTTLQIDLVTPAGHLVQHQWIQAIDGRAVGDIRLSDSLNSGIYQLRAYTDEDNNQHRPAFERNVTIYNPIRVIQPSKARPNLTPIDIQFLPEGGRWVTEVNARLGIKVVGGDGHGRRTSGRIVDERGVEVTRFATNAAGMGSVVVNPMRNYRYFAEVAETNRPPLRKELPVPDAEGLTLSADWVSDSTQLRIHLVGTGIFRSDSVYLLLQQNGQVVDNRKLLLQEGQLHINLPTLTLPAGLVQIMLFDGRGHPQAERLVFIPERLSPVQVIMQPDKPVYKARQTVNLHVSLTDDKQPVPAALSIAVTDADQLPEDGTATMRTHLLLTGELKGRVENPNEYLLDRSLTRQRSLDDLLLTQGWRRVNGTAHLDSLNGVSISGQVVGARGLPVKQGQLTIFSLQKSPTFIRTTLLDQQGRFRMSGLEIADTVTASVQIKDHLGKLLSQKEARLILDRVGIGWPSVGQDTTSEWKNQEAWIKSTQTRHAENPELFQDQSSRQLNEVTVRARKSEPISGGNSQQKLLGNADATVSFEPASNQFANLFEMMRGRLSGVNITMKPNGEGYQVLVRGVSSLMGSSTPLFLLDGKPIPEELLMTINPSEIERVDLLKNAGATTLYGARGGNGVIAFYTKTFTTGVETATISHNSLNTDANTIPLKIIGFRTIQKEFYVPKYEIEEQNQSMANIIDRRDVLYWKPFIQTNANGETTLLFPISDTCKKIMATVQGITVTGRPVSYSKIITVK